MLSELRDDNAQLAGSLRYAHEVCAQHNDVATTSLIEGWIKLNAATGFWPK